MFNPWIRKITWSRKWQPTSVFWPGKFHGQRNLVGYSPWGCKELGTTEPVSTAQQQILYLYNDITTQSTGPPSVGSNILAGGWPSCILSHVLLLTIPWTVAHQAPLSIGLPRPEYWSGLTFPSPGDPPNLATKPASPALAVGFFTTEPPGIALKGI